MKFRGRIVGAVTAALLAFGMLSTTASAQDLQTLLSYFLRDLYAGTIGTTLSVGVAAKDGTSGAPSFAFASEPTLGFFRSGAGAVTLQGGLFVSGNISPLNVNATTSINITGKWKGTSPADGIGVWTNNAATIGIEFKADALPTVASGFGTSPAVTAGSTPLAGSVNVGTGGVATSGVLNFNGTAYPSAPFVTCMNSTTAAVLRCTSSTTQLTITAAAAFTASDVVMWQAISAK